MLKNKIPSLSALKTKKSKYIIALALILGITLTLLTLLNSQQLNLFKGYIYQNQDNANTFIISDEVVNTNAICTPDNTQPIETLPIIAVNSFPYNLQELAIIQEASSLYDELEKNKDSINGTQAANYTPTAELTALKTKVNNLPDGNHLKTVLSDTNFTTLTNALSPTPATLTNQHDFLDAEEEIFKIVNQDALTPSNKKICFGHITTITFDKSKYNTAYDSIKVEIKNTNSSSTQITTKTESLDQTANKHFIMIIWSGYQTESDSPTKVTTPVNYNISLVDTDTNPKNETKIFGKTNLPVGDVEINPVFTYQNSIPLTFTDTINIGNITENNFLASFIQGLILNIKTTNTPLNTYHIKDNLFKINLKNLPAQNKLAPNLFVQYEIHKAAKDNPTFDDTTLIYKDTKINKVSPNGELDLTWTKNCTNDDQTTPCSLPNNDKQYYLKAQVTSIGFEDLIINGLGFTDLNEFSTIMNLNQEQDPNQDKLSQELLDCINTAITSNPTENPETACQKYLKNIPTFDLKFTNGFLRIFYELLLGTLSKDNSYNNYIFPINLQQTTLGTITQPFTANVGTKLTINLGETSTYEGPAQIKFNNDANNCKIEGTITNKVFTSTSPIPSSCISTPAQNTANFTLSHDLPANTNSLYKPNPESISFQATITNPPTLTVTLSTNPAVNPSTNKFPANTNSVELTATTNLPATCKWDNKDSTANDQLINRTNINTQTLTAKNNENKTHSLTIQNLSSTKEQTIYIQCKTTSNTPNLISNTTSFRFQLESAEIFTTNIPSKANLNSKVDFTVSYKTYKIPLAYIQITDGPNKFIKTISLVCDQDSTNAQVAQFCKENKIDTASINGPKNITNTWDTSLENRDQIKPIAGTYKYKIYALTETGLKQTTSGEIKLEQKNTSNSSLRGSANYLAKRSCENYFIDMKPTDKYCNEAAFLQEAGIFKGQQTNQGRIANLNAKLLRAEYFQIASRLLKSDNEIIDINYVKSFRDINNLTVNNEDNNWWLAAITSLKGIVRGYGDNTIKPYQQANQAELAKIAAETLIPGFKNNNFKNPWYEDTVNIFNSYRLRLNPEAPANRSDAVVILYYTLLINQGTIK